MFARNADILRDARHMVANFHEFTDVSPAAQLRLRALCWQVLKTAQGKPMRQARRPLTRPETGDISA